MDTICLLIQDPSNYLAKKLKISTLPLPLLAITFGMSAHAAFKILLPWLLQSVLLFILSYVPAGSFPRTLPQSLLL